MRYHIIVLIFLTPSFLSGFTQTLVYLPTFTTNQIITHKFYTLSYSEKHEQPQWVSYMICNARLTSVTERENNFKADPLVKTKSANPSDYAKSGYDRGHLCPAADMSFNDTAMAECFYMSNMSPQLPSFNRGIWKTLETQVRDWAKEKDTLYIVTGPILTEFIDTISVKNKIPVPKYFYKIILKYNGEHSTAIAFIILNNSTTNPLNTFVTTIDEVEKQTNIDFFPELPDNIENKVEKQIFIKDWDF